MAKISDRGEFRLYGIEKIVAEMNRELQKLGKRSTRGLINARILIQNKMEHEEPMIPVDWGNLRHSFFAVITDQGVETGNSPTWNGKDTAELQTDHTQTLGEMQTEVERHRDPVMIFGFSANYTLFVHEMVSTPSGKPVNWNRRGSGAKFFEEHLRESKNAMLEEVRKESYIK